MLTKVKQGEVTIHHNHSWITGAREFAFKVLPEVPHLKKIVQANFRQAHIKSGLRDPKIKIEKGNVVVEYFFDGSVQRFVLYQKNGLSTDKFEAIVKASLTPSTKEVTPVSTADQVATSQRVHEEINAARDRLFPIVEPSTKPGLRTVTMTDQAALGYEALLEKASSPDATSFTVDHASMVIKSVCTNPSYVMLMLRRLGVLDEGTPINGHQRRKRFKVTRVHYTLPERPRAKSMIPHVGVAVMPPTPIVAEFAPVPASVGTKNITVDGDIQELISKVQSRLENEFGFRPTISQTLRHIIKRAALGDT